MLGALRADIGQVLGLREVCSDCGSLPGSAHQVCTRSHSDSVLELFRGDSGFHRDSTVEAIPRP